MSETKLAEIERRLEALERRAAAQDSEWAANHERQHRQKERVTKSYLLVGVATAVYIVWMMFMSGTGPVPSQSRGSPWGFVAAVPGVIAVAGGVAIAWPLVWVGLAWDAYEKLTDARNQVEKRPLERRPP